MIGARKAPALLGVCALAVAVGCAALSEPTDSKEQYAQPIDRLLIGRAAQYPADNELSAKAPALEQSMADRRREAWKIALRVLEPVRIGAAPDDTLAPLELPRFQTWYSREDVLPMFDRLFRGLSDADKAARAPFADKAIDEVFPWNATMATSLASFTQDRLNARRAELSTPSGLHSLGKDTRVLMSPEYVAHLFKSYGPVLACPPGGGSPNDTRFAPCLAGEFPSAAVAIKTRWMPAGQVPTFDTSAASLTAKLKRGAFGDGDATATPDEASAYTMRLTPDRSMHLMALHIMTKELRDWAWITLWWSPDADSDFGADRPASLTGAFAHYKMCVVTAYGEKDASPGASFAQDHPTLAAALDASAAFGPSTWCSNPYLETQEHAATTSCIGCHQNGGTGETVDTILAAPDRFPDSARKKVRASFPTDYAFTTDGGLDLAAEMRARVEALSPH
jgi:hypothetical protein